MRDITKGGDGLEFDLYDKDDQGPHLNLTITTSTLQEKREWVEKIDKEIHSLDSFTLSLGNPQQNM